MVIICQGSMQGEQGAIYRMQSWMLEDITLGSFCRKRNQKKSSDGADDIFISSSIVEFYDSLLQASRPVLNHTGRYQRT